MDEKIKIAREWKKQGYPGYRPVKMALGLRERSVREVITGLKQKRNIRYHRHQKQNRTTITVDQAGILMAMDAGTLPIGDVIVRRDRGSINCSADQCINLSAQSIDTIIILEKLKAENRLPLALCTDNGSIFCATRVEDFLKKNKIIHLKSLPYVPQHNGSAENAVADLKSMVKYGMTLNQGCQTLNQHRRRQKLNYQTPSEFEQSHYKNCNATERALIYEAASTAIKHALLGTKTAYEKRKAEREAILQTLEDFSLITRTRGHPSCAVN